MPPGDRSPAGLAAPADAPVETLVRPAYDRGLAAVQAAGASFPWRSRSAYAHWLAQTYHYVVHTTRLIALCASRFDVQMDAYHRQLLEHLVEERDHDLLLVADLAALGHTAAEFPERPQTSALYQVVYYRVEHQTPFALFGYSLLLEGAAAEGGTDLADLVGDAHGEDSASFLRVHGEADPGHVERGFTSLEGIGAAESRVIAATLIQTGTLYAAVLNAIAAAVGSPAGE